MYRPSISSSRPSMAGPRSTGLSNRFSIQPVDFKRYSVNVPGTAQRQSMAPQRITNRAVAENVRNEHAKEMEKFFQEHNAMFPYSMKKLREGPARGEFIQWFEFLVKMLSRNYEMPAQIKNNSDSFNEEIPAVTNCLNYPYTLKKSHMTGFNAMHQWPTILAMLDWLRKLTLIAHEEFSTESEKQDYTIKYAFDCYKQAAYGNSDFTQILDAIREIIVSGGAEDLGEEIQKAQQAIEENDSKLELEKAAIAQMEKEISDYQREIDMFTNGEEEIKSTITSMESQIVEADKEVKLMEEKLQQLRVENEALTKQVATQPMSSHEAHELLQKRSNLRDEFKEKKARHEELYREQAKGNKLLTKLATEKTEMYRRFCSDIFQYARSFNADTQYRNFEYALFGKNASVDSLRASQLGSEVTDMFRSLMNGIRGSIQQRLEEINKERLDTKLKQLENDNRMRQQQLQQIEQRNMIELNTRNIALREAENQLKQTRNEYDAANQRVNEVAKQNDDMNARADAQAATTKQFEAKLANIDTEESVLLNKFADYMLEATTRFESLSKTNEDLLKQKEMLLDACSKVTEYVKLLIKDAGNECQSIRGDFVKFEKLPENDENWQ